MTRTARPTRTAATLATVDPQSSVWIHQIPYPLLRNRYEELGLLRGLRLRSVQHTDNRVRVELRDGEAVSIPLDHAHCIEVLQVVDGADSRRDQDGWEPAGIGRSGETSVYWIGTDPASLRPLGGTSTERRGEAG